jgi:hypothetical protein
MRGEPTCRATSTRPAPQSQPLDSEIFAIEFEKLGVAPDRARAYAIAARQSLVSFQRAAGRGSVPVPTWELQLASRVVRRAWLCGGWSKRRTADTDAISSAIGTQYFDASDELRATADGPDPLFTVVGEVWRVSSLQDSWAYCRRRLTIDDLRAIEEVVETVLGATDPSLDLPVAERWKADIYGLTRIHSTDLRRGLASRLAFLAERGDNTNLGGGSTAALWAEGTSAKLMTRARADASWLHPDPLFLASRPWRAGRDPPLVRRIWHRPCRPTQFVGADSSACSGRRDALWCGAVDVRNGCHALRQDVRPGRHGPLELQRSVGQ